MHGSAKWICIVQRTFEGLLCSYLRVCRCTEVCMPLFVYVSLVLFALNYSPLPTCCVNLRSQKVLSQLARCPALGGATLADLAWAQMWNLSGSHLTQPSQIVFHQTKMDLFACTSSSSFHPVAVALLHSFQSPNNFCSLPSSLEVFFFFFWSASFFSLHLLSGLSFFKQLYCMLWSWLGGIL